MLKNRSMTDRNGQNPDERVCGYCYTNTHELCRPVIRWYEKAWYCNCACQETNKKESE